MVKNRKPMNDPIPYNGFMIYLEGDRFQLYTMDEWNRGEGYRYPEHDTGSVQEAKQFINCY